MMPFSVGFMCGALVGLALGILVLGFCIAARRADDEEEKIIEYITRSAIAEARNAQNVGTANASGDHDKQPRPRSGL